MSVSTVLFEYPPLVAGILRRRYKRFFAEVELADGQLVTAHCPNTGPMRVISTPGSRVYLSRATAVARKLAYTWEMIDVEGVWVGVNTAMPNRIVYEGLRRCLFSELGDYTAIRREVPYGSENSRVDFLLDGSAPLYLEIKSTTLHRGRLALFPDTVTTRGQKHLRELTRLCEQGSRAAILYFINRSDCTAFSPCDEFDPLYGELLRIGIERGLQVLPYRFEITPETVRFLGLASIVLA
ncbi:DNA/RNA nuclease SfsA [Gloeobacter kilaueensis]|uniref:Sugar fermentation stimulation protein homolog n=1 Tax=Gloeobacter kilaueensis (strain ATCC BAA-2537 / CCAP 1431/1 / ULC 316 / JS1) TaxID=1183438 RepID=U5QLR7_GLOK1|nr:DNA/RNA nuclease SfsA [Gloeobacter kilaueensis]AGY59927.1 sugar fermentation stimulation protein A [Gloeobacter kilaueensis JS1]